MLSTGHALSSASGSGTAWSLTYFSAVDQGQDATLAYSGSTVTAVSGGAVLAAFNGSPVTNNPTFLSARQTS